MADSMIASLDALTGWLALRRWQELADGRFSVPIEEAQSVCSRKDCGKEAKVRGMCRAHYAHWRYEIKRDLAVRFGRPPLRSYP